MKSKRLPRFRSQRAEAEHWMAHDTAGFWDSFEDLDEPVEASPRLRSELRARHERTKAISIRLYPSQLRLAKAIAGRKHVPYQALLRDIIESGLREARPRPGQ